MRRADSVNQLLATTAWPTAVASLELVVLILEIARWSLVKRVGG
jgi:hypothetical protein